MAHASKKHIGVGSHGKGSGSGAMTNTQRDMLGENDVLSNRDKARHSDERGMDGREIQNEQYQDHESNKVPRDSEQERD